MADHAERAVFLRLRKVITHPTLLRDVVKRVNTRQQAEAHPLQQRLTDIQKERRKAESARGKLVRLFDPESGDGDWVKEELAKVADRLRTLDAEEADLTVRLATCETAQSVPFEVVQIVLEDFVRKLQDADDSQRGALLQLLVQEINFEKGKGVTSIRLRLSDDVARALGIPTPTGLPGTATLMA